MKQRTRLPIYIYAPSRPHTPPAPPPASRRPRGVPKNLANAGRLQSYLEILPRYRCAAQDQWMRRAELQIYNMLLVKSLGCFMQ